MWDINATLKHLEDHAQPNWTGWCAKYVREALAAGGLVISTRPGSAKDYGAALREVGFREIKLQLPLHSPLFLDFPPDRDSPFTSGDVAVFQGVPNATDGTQHGHIQMFDGNAWISDWRQAHFSPGPSFNSVQVRIYRHRQFM